MKRKKKYPKIIQLTKKMKLNHLSKKEYTALKKMCSLSKAIYNIALYNVRQHFFNTKEYLSYNKNYTLIKNDKITNPRNPYGYLHTGVCQQIIKKVDDDFNSFFGLLKKKNQGKYNDKVRIPHYKDKDSYFLLIYPQVVVKNGYITLPMSPKFKKDYGTVKIKYPEYLKGKKLNEIRIIPKYNGNYFEVEFVYSEIKTKINKNNNVLSIDLGIDNLCTCFPTVGRPFIIDGKKLKSFNQYYNKVNTKLQSIKDKQKIDNITQKQVNIIRKRNNRINDIISKAGRRIINYCLDNDISTIVLGYNEYWKQSINIGRKNNQKFVQIPHGKLKDKLNYLCELYGLSFCLQEESYTSKASSLDNDNIPVYDVDNPKIYNFSGKRISRGQYKSGQGFIINADLNGAINILRKSKHVACPNTSLLCRGVLFPPLRIRVVA